METNLFNLAFLQDFIDAVAFATLQLQIMRTHHQETASLHNDEDAQQSKEYQRMRNGGSVEALVKGGSHKVENYDSTNVGHVRQHQEGFHLPDAMDKHNADQTLNDVE